MYKGADIDDESHDCVIYGYWEVKAFLYCQGNRNTTDKLILWLQIKKQLDQKFKDKVYGTPPAQ